MSARKATIGSTREARRAGRYVASSATAARTPETTAYVIGSSGPTPNRNADITRVNANATPIPSDDAGRGQRETLAEKHLPDISSLCAERHPNADLARPLRRSVGNHAVDANHADQQRDARGDAEHHQRKRCLRHRARLNLFERLHVRQRQVRDRPTRSLARARVESRACLPVWTARRRPSCASDSSHSASASTRLPSAAGSAHRRARRRSRRRSRATAPLAACARTRLPIALRQARSSIPVRASLK